MSDAVKKLLPSIERLTADEREELRAWLNEMEYPEGGDDDLTPEQLAEIDRRIDAIDPNDPGIPAEEVFRRIDAKLAAMRAKAAG